MWQSTMRYNFETKLTLRVKSSLLIVQLIRMENSKSSLVLEQEITSRPSKFILHKRSGLFIPIPPIKYALLRVDKIGKRSNIEPNRRINQFIEKIFQTPFRKMSDHIDRNNRPLFLFKPHGSCNWGWRVNNKQHLNVQNKN